MDKRVWYVLIYKKEIIHPLKSETMPFAARRLDLETVILSKVRQRSRNIIQHPLCPVSILHLHKSAAWAFWIVLRVECEYVCYTSGSSFPQMLCRCLILHSPNQGIMPLLMLVPPPGMTFTNVSTY